MRAGRDHVSKESSIPSWMREEYERRGVKPPDRTSTPHASISTPGPVDGDARQGRGPLTIQTAPAVTQTLRVAQPEPFPASVIVGVKIIAWLMLFSVMLGLSYIVLGVVGLLILVNSDSSVNLLSLFDPLFLLICAAVAAGATKLLWDFLISREESAQAQVR